MKYEVYACTEREYHDALNGGLKPPPYRKEGKSEYTLREARSTQRLLEAQGKRVEVRSA